MAQPRGGAACTMAGSSVPRTAMARHAATVPASRTYGPYATRPARAIISAGSAMATVRVVPKRIRIAQARPPPAAKHHTGAATTAEASAADIPVCDRTSARTEPMLVTAGRRLRASNGIAISTAKDRAIPGEVDSCGAVRVRVGGGVGLWLTTASSAARLAGHGDDARRGSY